MVGQSRSQASVEEAESRGATSRGQARDENQYCNKDNNDSGDEFATDMNDFDKHDNDPVVARNREIIANSNYEDFLQS